MTPYKFLISNSIAKPLVMASLLITLPLLSACNNKFETKNAPDGSQSSSKDGAPANTNDGGSSPDGATSNPDGGPASNAPFAEKIQEATESFASIDNEKQMATQNYDNGGNSPISVNADGQVIKDKIIYAGRNDDCGIRTNGHDDVKIENVTIYHANVGVCADGSKGLRIDGLKLVSLAAPPTGPHCPRGGGDGLSTGECWGGDRGAPADSRLGVALKNSPDATITDMLSVQASSGVYAVNSPRTNISKIRCFDMRGPFPRGQCVQFNASDNSSVTTFYAKNYFDQSHCEDNFNAYKSDNVTIKDGLIDGNWSNNGIGIIADRGSDDMTIEDVDFLHISTSSVNVWSNEPDEIGKNFKATKLRAKNTQCFSRKESSPSTGGLILAAQPTSINPVFDDVMWFNHCRATTTWCLPGQGCRQNNTGSATNIREQDFTTRWTNE